MAPNSVKILEISAYPPPRAGWGIRVYYLKKELERRGDVCEVLNIGKSRTLTGRDFVPCFGAADYVRKVLRFRLRSFLVHMHLNGDSPKGFLLTLAALGISALTGRRAVITFHAGPEQTYFPRSRAPALVPMFKLIFGLSRYIVCNEEKVKARIVEYGVDPSKVFPIQAFSRQYLEFRRVQLPAALARVFDTASPVVAIYMFFRPGYRIEDMFRALRSLLEVYPRAAFLILGDHRPEDPELASYAERCMALARELGIDRAMHFAGDLDHDAFLTALEKSTVFFRTHVVDGVSSSVLEALALGVPVVAVDNGIRPPQVFTYRDGDVSEMVRLLRHVIDHNQQVRSALVPPPIPDTISEEIALLERA